MKMTCVTCYWKPIPLLAFNCQCRSLNLSTPVVFSTRCEGVSIDCSEASSSGTSLDGVDLYRLKNKRHWQKQIKRSVRRVASLGALSSAEGTVSGGNDDFSLACLAIAAALEAASSLPVKILSSLGTASLLSLSSEDFLALCEAQLDICAGMLAPGDKLTVFMRTPDSYASGLLELQCVATYPDPHPGAQKGESFVLSVDESGEHQPRTAETALVAHEAVELPERGSLVLPLAKGSFVVGLLVAERAVENRPPGINKTLSKQEFKLKRPLWPPPKSLPAPIRKDGSGSGKIEDFEPQMEKNASFSSKSLFSSREKLEAAKIATTLALACVMDQRSLLIQQSAWQRSLLIDGLVDEVQAPLAAFRTLGRMLLPQLKQGELSRDIVDSMLVQGDQIRNVFEKLQQAVNPVPNPGRTGDYSKINEGSQYNLPSTEDTERLDNRKFDAD